MIGDNSKTGQTRKLSWREKIRNQTRSLRKIQTASEKILWEHLRNRKMMGKKFYRQFPITYMSYQRPYYFIADFYCHNPKIVIEIDGTIHNYKREYDNQREQIIKDMGINVIRIMNEEIDNIDDALEKIKTHINIILKQASNPSHTLNKRRT